MSCSSCNSAMQQSLAGIQNSAASLQRSAGTLRAPAEFVPAMQSRDSLRDIVDLSHAARAFQANAVVFTVAAEMSNIAMALGSRLDRFA